MDVFELELAGRTLIIETGRLAQLADAAVLVRYGDTAVLVTACASAEPKQGIDFFPLSVDYEERLYAVGKIPGGFIKREGRPTEKAILSARLIDRPIRPLFPHGYRNDVQVVATVLSVDQDNLPEIAAMIGSSAALSISTIPFQGPTGSVLVGSYESSYLIPIMRKEKRPSLSCISTKDAVMMIEAGASSTGDVMLGCNVSHDNIKRLLHS